ncbi:hypothetical protein CDD80_3343 [Ophiocordyceps camponoti-rufipedis]|uniref:Uncharacterized protein n=1 Tax=Ophiocordyceps camponoti-rufipedis TaxID=2004952 RepID=A0A2C5ZP31_9HYPO|nr:hypothetical protein CDD80_3343 [Ophiocordyceps camponoti-rufipedis]
MVIEKKVSIISRALPYLRVQGYRAMEREEQTLAREVYDESTSDISDDYESMSDTSDGPNSDISDESTAPLFAQTQTVSLAIIYLIGEGVLGGNIVWKEDEKAGNLFGVVTTLETTLVFARWLLDLRHAGYLRVPSCRTVRSFIRGVDLCFPAHLAAVPLEFRASWMGQGLVGRRG